MSRKIPIFYSALMLTGVNLLLRFVGTSFQVYLSGSIGAAGIGLVQLVMSVGVLAMVAGMGGIRTGAMYLAAEELGHKKPQNVTWILSGSFLYSVIFSFTVAGLLYVMAPQIATFLIRDPRTVGALRLYAGFLPCVCLCGVMTGYFTAANRIGTLAAIEVAEQIFSMIITLCSLHFWAGTDPVRASQCVILGSSLGSCFTLTSLVLLRVVEKPPRGPRIPVGYRLRQTALPLALADDLRTGISTAENLIVPRRLSMCTAVASPLAAFGMITGMVFPVLMFPACIIYALAELLIPELARCNAAGSSHRVTYLVRRSLKVTLLYSLIFSGGMFLLSEPLCTALYNEAQIAKHLRQYSCLIPMLYCDAITDAMIKGLGQQKMSVRYNILTNILDVAFLYLLLPRYGIGGYFFSFLVTHIINFGLSYRRLLKITKLQIPWHIPIFSLACGAFAIWVSSHTQRYSVQVILYLVILFSELTALGILDRNDFRWMRSLVCKKPQMH
jgi:stage V sporulation protein B